VTQRRLKQSTTLRGRLAQLAQEACRRAGMLALGEERDRLLQLVIQIESVSQMEELLRWRPEKRSLN